MYFGDTVTLLSHGIHVPKDEIAPIGITSGSIAWARWLPDVRALADRSKTPRPPHLVLSPFSVGAWPALVRVELRLNDKRGAMASATAVLRNEGLNILDIDGTPSGHHHATLCVVGEALPIRQRADDNVFTLGNSWRAADRHFGNHQLWKYCCGRLAPEMLRYSASLDAAIRKADRDQRVAEGEGFLRETFSDPTHSRRGVLYSHLELPEDVADIGRTQSPTAVRCTWLQEMAFFWLYHAVRAVDIRLTYDGTRSSFIASAGHDAFAEPIRNFAPPLKSMVSINSFSKYMRVALADADRWGNTVSVNIPFRADLASAQGSSIGFQHEICKALESTYTIRKVAITTSELSDFVETGELRLAVSTTPPRPLSSEDMSDVLDRIRSSPAAIGPHIAILPSASVRRLQARRLFLSTRYKWLALGDSRHQIIRELAMSHGFDLIDARQAAQVPGFRHDPSENISVTALRLIQTCDAVLQIIPAWKRDNLQWLLFESGAARALRRPIGVCVECVDSIKPERELGVEAWQDALRVTHGTQLFPFYSPPTLDLPPEPIDPALFPDLKSAVRDALLPLMMSLRHPDDA